MCQRSLVLNMKIRIPEDFDQYFHGQGALCLRSLNLSFLQ